MATIQKRGNSYTIKVSCGYDIKGKQIVRTVTWKPEPSMSPRHVEKELNRQAVLFEEKCLKGYQSRAVKFEEFAEQWFEDYAKTNLRNTTYERMRWLSFPKDPQKEKEIYTPQEIETLLNLLEKEPLKYRVFFNLIVYSGFRRGEMMGLEWKDIDFDGEIISVRRTSNYTPDKGVYTDTTKTKKSQRSLKFPHFIMELLKEYKAEQREHAQKLGNKWVENDRLFVKWNGEPMYNGQPYSWLSKFCESNGLPFRGIHCFRHSFASFLVNQGVDIVTVSGALGHSAVSTTNNVYCHMLQEAQARVSVAVTNALDFHREKDGKTTA